MFDLEKRRQRSVLDTVFFFWKALEQALVKLEIMLKQASPSNLLLLQLALV